MVGCGLWGSGPDTRRRRKLKSHEPLCKSDELKEKKLNKLERLLPSCTSLFWCTISKTLTCNSKIYV